MDITATFKSIFGENKLSIEEFAAALEKNKDIKLANLKDGEYVSSEKYSSLETEAKNYKTQLSDVNKQLEKLKNSNANVEELKQEIETLRNDNQSKSEEYENKINELRMTSAIKLAIGDKAHDADLVTSLIDKNLIKIQDDNIIGLDEQIKSIREKKAFLFKNDKQTQYDPKGGGGAADVNPWAKDTFNLTKQGEIYKEDPAKAKELMQAAGITGGI